MEKLKVIFRKEYNEYTKEWDVIAFMPEVRVSNGYICYYSHVGQHGEADYLYYLKSTKKATPEEYADLLTELRRIYDDVELVVRERIHHKDLANKAWKMRI